MTSLYEHSQPEGGNAKLICILKVLSQAALLLELHRLCVCVSTGLIEAPKHLKKTPTSCIFYDSSFLLFLTLLTLWTNSYIHVFNAPFGS